MARKKRKNVLAFMLGVGLIGSGAGSCAQPASRAATVQTRQADSVVRTPEDEAKLKRAFDAAAAQKLASLPIGERVAELGKLFLGTPYVGGTLEAEAPREPLILNLRGLDCVTFYETALAGARAIKASESPTMEQFASELRRLRYRGGENTGYASRLHYSSDYFYDAERKNILHDVTEVVGGPIAVRDARTINFMSTHRSAYKQLQQDDAELEKIRQIEARMAERGGFPVIPKQHVEAVSSRIQSGDIIGIVTSIEGLDMSHTGIAVKEADGSVRFLHASSAKKQVVLSDGTLADYVNANGRAVGIVVHRPVEVAPSR